MRNSNNSALTKLFS